MSAKVAPAPPSENPPALPDPEAQSQEGKDHEDFFEEKASPSTKAKTYIAASVAALILPLGFFVYGSWSGGALCESTMAECVQTCKETYAEIVIIFQSQKRGEMGCRADCETDAVDCQAKAQALAVAAIGIGISICCGILLTIVFPFLDGKGDDDRVSDAIATVTTRPAYSEPRTLEHDLFEQKAKKFRWFWEDKFVQPRMTDITCDFCGYKFTCDYKWFKAAKGGIDPLRCPRCTSIQVGLL
eukprot:TRINITY_DN15571_c0_g1_i1.p1 TRINITY_DN15571_c0_g1~~TRINITY_DN15571_c0_g1_i1.p1  ORF type:complete len:243 (+),score=33.18 TRINITY_DN15571_c0_g1_i1:65-793(+)